MIVFEVSLNGTPLCRAGVAAGVLSAIVGWVGGETPDSVQPSESDLYLTVGGLYRSPDPSTAHPRWVEHRELAPGDELVIRIAEAGACDRPVAVHVTTAEDVEQQQHAYYKRMKAHFEPTRNRQDDDT